MREVDSAPRAGARPALSSPDEFALICFSSLRWNFLDRRLQHLMRCFADAHRVLFWEEPVFGDSDEATLDVRACPATGVVVVVPRLPVGRDEADQEATLRTLLEIFLAGQQRPLVRWYFTPTMLPFSRQIHAVCTIYDGTHQTAGIPFAPSRRAELERELLGLAEIVVTGDGPEEVRTIRDPKLRRALSIMLGDRFDPASDASYPKAAGKAFMLGPKPALPSVGNPQSSSPLAVSAQ